MKSKISSGVTINIDTYYQPEYSNPLNHEFMFAYKITIENTNTFPVKLLRRRWYIIDSNGVKKEVEGEGVVGVQPVIEPSSNYQYISGCHLSTEMGKMHGSYVMENMHNKSTFHVMIPAFYFEAPLKLN